MAYTFIDLFAGCGGLSEGFHKADRFEFVAELVCTLLPVFALYFFFTCIHAKMVKDKFDRYGNRLLFFARFLPGLRTPVYIITGITRRVGFVRFLLIDFFAAIISVPIWVYLGHHGAENIDWIKAQMRHGQMGIYLILAAVVIFIGITYWKRKRKQAEQK